MERFRKKPVVIEAAQWTGEEIHLEDFPEASFSFNRLEPDGPNLYVHTLEGVMKANPGDWIIKGVKGEIYPCKPDIFQATYEKVEE